MTIAQGPRRLLENKDMSANITSDMVKLAGFEGLAIQAVYTGAPDGTLYVEASIDGVTFTKIPTTNLVISAAGDVLYNLINVNYIFARLVWEFSSGTGVLNAFFSMKEDQ